MAVFTMTGPEIALEVSVNSAEGGGFGFQIDQTPTNNSGRESITYRSILRYVTREQAEERGKYYMAELSMGQIDRTALEEN